jgi:hypothetical protein
MVGREGNKELDNMNLGKLVTFLFLVCMFKKSITYTHKLRIILPQFDPADYINEDSFKDLFNNAHDNLAHSQAMMICTRYNYYGPVQIQILFKIHHFL